MGQKDLPALMKFFLSAFSNLPNFHHIGQGWYWEFTGTSTSRFRIKHRMQVRKVDPLPLKKGKIVEQAGTELGRAQLKLGPGFTSTIDN